MLDTSKLYVKVLPLGSDGETYGNEVKIVAATDVYVIYATISQYLPKNEQVMSRADFEKNFITTDEKSRRVKAARDKTLRKIDALYGAKPKLGEPAEIGRLTYRASNGVEIRFDELGHVYFPEVKTKNPLSSFDVPWIAAKSKALRDAYDARERYRMSYRYW